MKTITLNRQQLLENSDKWNELLCQSFHCLPTVCAESIDIFLDTFDRAKDFFAIVAVDENENWVAALPLIIKKNKLQVRVATLPSNEWSFCGDFLLNPVTDFENACRAIFTALARRNIHALWLEWINLDAPQWRALTSASSNCYKQSFTDFPVGLIRLGNDWSEFQKQLSKNQRKKLRRYNREIGSLGTLKYWSWLQADRNGDLESAIKTAFEIEDKSWKGDQGESVLQTEKMFDFFMNLALELDRHHMFDLHILSLNDRPIAFDYGYILNRVFHSHKVSFDPEFSQYSPGHLMNEQVIQNYLESGICDSIDAMGILDVATASWSNSQYSRGKLIMSTGTVVGQALTKSFVAAKKTVRRIRGFGKSAPISESISSTHVNAVNA